jgi:hypothetical protein
MLNTHNAAKAESKGLEIIAARSFQSVALERLFTTAMSGRSKERQELAQTGNPLSAHLPVIAATLTTLSRLK